MCVCFSFNKRDLVPLVMFSNVAFGLFGGGNKCLYSSIANHSFISQGLSTTLTLVKVVPFWVRFIANGLLMLGGI